MLVADTHRFSYSVDTVLWVLCDAEHVRQKHESLGARHVRATRSPPEGASTLVTVVCEREIPSDVPAPLQRLVGAWTRVTQTDRWTIREGQPPRCDLEARLHGVPLTVRGSMVLRDAPEGCANRVEVELTSRVPLIGRALVRIAARDIARSMGRERDFTADYLRRHAEP